MKFSKQDLLTMLIGLFLFSSCKDANTIGLGQEESAIAGELYDNTIVTSRTELDDAQSASSLTRYPVGAIKDDIFGITTAGTAMTVNIPAVKYRFGKNAVLDSAVLILPYSAITQADNSKGTPFYGDSTQTYTFTVGQMAKDLTRERSFLSSTNWGEGITEVLGTLVTNQPTGPQGAIFIKPLTPFKVTEIVAGKPDTLRSVPPQLRIRLNTALIQNKIINMDTLAYDRNNLFIEKFNGLYVSASATNKGGMIFFNLTDTLSKLQLFYKRDGKSPATRDTAVISFPIKQSTTPVVAYVKHNYDNTAIKTQLDDNSEKQFDETYIQALSGLRNRISFNFDAFKAMLGTAKVAINKAELVIDVTPERDAHFKPAPRLMMYRRDAAGTRKNITDNDPLSQTNPYGDPRANPLVFGGYFDSVNGRYIFSVTSHVQDLIDGTKKDDGTFIAPTPVSEPSVSPWASSAERSILVGPKKDAASGTKRMKLNIYYTKLK
ncbi:DUF4270 domain-containing protein [Pedobacter caeni]|uniref:DUF4270 domain-containing protein n=1 Tax=Pedobacter caeni TaxID=288992 RepID=A0A1M5D120_9SPHI|nr:DUF4270 domain-containing protein [Pedobacter caeni]SHF60681.1 protein of unknown function [Pedobacter caeni]